MILTDIPHIAVVKHYHDLLTYFRQHLSIFVVSWFEDTNNFKIVFMHLHLPLHLFLLHMDNTLNNNLINLNLSI